MSCLNKYQWELVPQNLPIVKRSCPKCNEKTNYINSEKFRINANKNSIDIWLIYKCEKCKSTWNMTIYERIKPCNVSKHEYNRFLSNDRELAREYAFNSSIYSKNKAEVFLDNISYRLVQRKLDTYYIKENELVIEIICKYPIDLRVDKLLSDILGISRSKIKGMIEKGIVFVNDNKNSSNIKVRCGMEIHVLQAVKNIEFLKGII
ncbi:DUF1062 domain-containing protein [Clostridium folliculivorans]|uniref:RNA-binding S4 domain-containing protein n=1 Tax=Clostridium folliculivorans TaxID=2886038 RepID=A0A9W5Y244_9CLOT|nr:DUF1062 domain-containing protein [Clostridium folliculivorans]GKU25178.1 hypothetical protein CFOLD11_20040 [Clostridium folliculivorans]GKU31276.1 hypothetical protein CFB3_33830 [Clostridium folliculivorans]